MGAEKKDLVPRTFPANLKWSQADAVESLERLYKFANEECDRSIVWYFEKKRGKRIAAYVCRVGAIIAAAASGVVPILGGIYKTNDVPDISPAWATVAIAIVGILIALDRFGGYTSGWVRYVRAAQALTELQSDFRVEWELQRQALQSNPSDAETLKQSIGKCKEYLGRVHAIVRAETDQWAQEFQKILVELDKGVEK
jgi:hypothetical protein